MYGLSDKFIDSSLLPFNSNVSRFSSPSKLIEISLLFHIWMYSSFVFLDRSMFLRDCLSIVSLLRLVKFSIPDKSSKKPTVLPPVGSDKSNSLIDSNPDLRI